jgi:flagellin FlaB
VYNKFFKHEKGITGLETAIILIAFVVVAAVFAYTALSAGLFATQKSQEAIYSGLKEAQSTLELKGSVIATANVVGDSGNIQQISFIVANVLGGEPVDFTPPDDATSVNGTASDTSANKVVIKFIDKDQTVNNLFWTFTPLGNDNGNNLLEMNEKFQVTVGSDTPGSDGGNLVNALAPDLGSNTSFTLEVLTPGGAVLQIPRNTPPTIDKIMNLH